MDLMIHDLDIILSLNKSKIKDIQANGINVLTSTTDIAHARITFENGCVCNLSASRISDKIERKMRVFQKNAYFSLDYQNYVLDTYRKLESKGIKKIEKKQHKFKKNDSLNEEIKSFIKCIATKKNPIVSGHDGLTALKYAIKISNLIKKMIPQFDLKKEYALLEKEIQHELKKVFTKTNFISGENVKLIEYNIANYIGSKYAVSCNSGTDALHFALKSLGIGKGDEVITTPFTFISTLEAIMYVRATPVFADIDFNTYNINIDEVLKKVSKNTKAILPVHMFGNPVDINLLKEKLNNNSINIIEDCAQSFGAGINNRRVGSVSNIGCFSFYPTKNLGCYGDGGMITTNSEDAYNQIKN